jgi:thioredoxin-related protein
MFKWQRHTEVIANVILIGCGCLFGTFLIKDHLSASASGSPQPTDAPAHSSLIGKNLSATGIDWTANRQTLMLVLRKGCHFCEASTPFYQRLAKEMSTNPKTHLMAVMPTGDAENRQYLKDNKIDLPDVRKLSASSIGVRGTPTLLLVDGNGVVLNEWIGKLPPTQEQAVITRVSQ